MKRKKATRFKKIYIEITNACNLQCRFCPPSLRRKRFLSVIEMATILQKINGYTHYVYLHVKGEPLLHPNISEILDLCFEHQLLVVLVTNGTFLNSKGNLLLEKPALRQVNISLHCFNELENQEEKERYVEGVISFTKKALSETDKVISLRFWNVGKADDNTNEGNRRLFCTIEDEFAPGFNIAQKLVPADGLKIGERLWINSDYEFEWPRLELPETNKSGTCRGLRDQIAILADGTVVPCCVDAEGIIKLGNLFDSDLADILATPRSQTIVQGFLKSQRIEPLCRRCGFF